MAVGMCFSHSPWDFYFPESMVQDAALTLHLKYLLLPNREEVVGLFPAKIA